MKERFIIRETVKFGIMNYHKRSFQFHCKNLMILLFFAMQAVPYTEQRGPELTFLQISPNSNFVALGQPLKLLVTCNVTGRYRDVYIVWSFRRFSSTNSISRKELAKAQWLINRDGFRQFSLHDSRVSIVDNGTLVLVNTTLNDSGTYEVTCEVRQGGWLFTTKKYQLFFNVTIVEDELKAEISCSQSTKLNEGDRFSCWCFAVGFIMVRTASWVKSDRILGDASSPTTRLTLLNVSKDTAGTYVCRANSAKNYSLVDERSTEIIVYYHPRITFFERGTFQNNLLQLTCLADGLPEPSYTFLTSKGTELAQINNGVVIIRNYSSTFNESYTCIAKNKLGGDEQRLNVDLDLLSTAKKQQKGNNNGIEWYIPLISGIVGVLTGIGLVCVFLWIRKRHVLAAELTTQFSASSTIYSEPQQENSPTADEANVYVNVPLKECSSSHYQGLSKVRANEESIYQGLVSQAE